MLNTTENVEVLHDKEEEMSRFLIPFETALELSARDEDEPRLLGLQQLHEMAEQTAKIREHCRQGAQTLDTAPFLFADNKEWARLRKSYAQLERASFEFRRELVFATTLSTEILVARGRRLIALLREHIGYEGELLKRIEAIPLSGPAPLGIKE